MCACVCFRFIYVFSLYVFLSYPYVCVSICIYESIFYVKSLKKAGYSLHIQNCSVARPLLMRFGKLRGSPCSNGHVTHLEEKDEGILVNERNLKIEVRSNMSFRYS